MPELSASLKTALDMIEAWLAAKPVNGGPPGLTAALVRDQNLIWIKGFGLADVEKGTLAGPETIYRVASITKLFTATAIMQLRDQGLLSLEDEVARHLPWFRLNNPYPDSPPVRIRHLLTHTSGLPREAAFPCWSEPVFPDRDAVAAALPGQEVVFPPEQRWKYSNLAVTLAGEIVAVTSGLPYADYIYRHILNPLGMDSTYVGPAPDDRAEKAAGYGPFRPQGDRERRPDPDCGGIAPAANLAATALDLAKFVSLQFQAGPKVGDQILSGYTLAEMQQVHWLEPGWTAGWGYGFRIMRLGGRTYVGHGGNYWGFRTLIQLRPEDKLGLIVLTNAEDVEPVVYATKMFELLDQFAPGIGVTGQDHPTGSFDPAWRRYLGDYRNPRRHYRVLEGVNGLRVIEPETADPSITLSRLRPLTEPGEFLVETTDGYGIAGEKAIFETDAEGRVIGLRWGENFLYSVPE